MVEVMFYGGKRSDETSNNGIKEYMKDSVETDRVLFETAYRFYKKLKIADEQRRNGKYEMSPIQQVAEFDVMAMALQEAHGNFALATKVLAIYGHDNEEKILDHQGNNCRTGVLNHLRPAYNSTLYLNGAIQNLAYDSKDVVINTPIIRTIIEHAGTSVLSNLGPMTAVTDRLYLTNVRNYKIERFRDYLDWIEKAKYPGLEPLSRALRVGLDRIADRVSPALSPAYSMPMKLRPIAAAILQRREVRFQCSTSASWIHRY